jgi:hypothetical protein
MKKLVAAGLFAVALVELAAIAILDRQLVVAATGVMVALVLVSLRWWWVRETEVVPEAACSDDAAQSLRRWMSRTESLIARSEAGRRDWDRHLRPMLARQFEMATGQRQAKDRAAFEATGRMLFGPQLWAWVDPQNVSRTPEGEPGPGREVLDEILQRLEQV